jgi:hypothetical protein
MIHLVILDTRAGELEKILSGIKTMLIRESDPAQTITHPVRPGDSLYFLRTMANVPCASKPPCFAFYQLWIAWIRVYLTP